MDRHRVRHPTHNCGGIDDVPTALVCVESLISSAVLEMFFGIRNLLCRQDRDNARDIPWLKVSRQTLLFFLCSLRLGLELRASRIILFRNSILRSSKHIYAIFLRENILYESNHSKPSLSKAFIFKKTHLFQPKTYMSLIFRDDNSILTAFMNLKCYYFSYTSDLPA